MALHDVSRSVSVVSTWVELHRLKLREDKHTQTNKTRLLVQSDISVFNKVLSKRRVDIIITGDVNGVRIQQKVYNRFFCFKI